MLSGGLRERRTEAIILSVQPKRLRIVRFGIFSMLWLVAIGKCSCLIFLRCSCKTLQGNGIRAEIAQLVEHQLPKLRVAGSNPVFRSRIFRSPALEQAIFSFLVTAQILRTRESVASSQFPAHFAGRRWRAVQGSLYEDDLSCPARSTRPSPEESSLMGS